MTAVTKSYIRKMRLLNKPNELLDVFDPVPIFPPRKSVYVGARIKHDYHREIAWSIDYRGVNDDIPTLLYVGAGYTLVKSVFMPMFGKSSLLFSGFKLYRDYYLYQRQKKAWVRIAIELRNFNTDMMSVEDLGNILQRKIQQMCLCNIKYVKLEKLLNL